MPDADAIAQQQELLAVHRRTLAHLLQQVAQFSAGHLPAHVANGIAEARASIAHCKAALRGWGEMVEDRPDDAEPEPLLVRDCPPSAAGRAHVLAVGTPVTIPFP